MPMKEIEELNQKFVEQLSPVRVYLFGSYANGTYTKDSDFDFYIIVENDVSDLADIVSRAYRSIRKIKKHPVDIIVGTEDRFEQRKTIPSVENEVYQKGVLLYGARDKAMA